MALKATIPYMDGSVEGGFFLRRDVGLMDSHVLCRRLCLLKKEGCKLRL